MRIRTIIDVLNSWAPPALQEDYDNSGLQVGDPEAEVEAALLCLDCTEEVVLEAARTGCGLVIAHHPVIFRPLRSLTGRNAVERTILAAVRHGVAIHAIHTNLDNVITGVNAEIAARLGLQGLSVLDPKAGQLRKLAVFVPHDHAEAVREALFAAGAGQVGAYDQCSFNLRGEGTFRGGAGTDPFVGRVGERHVEPETRVEVIYPVTAEGRVVKALLAAHPYEEVAYDLVPLANGHPGVGSGAVGTLAQPLTEGAFLARVKEVFGAPVVRHTGLTGREIRRVAVCGGSGAFLIGKALAAGVDAYLTADVKYHEFFQPEGRLLLADIGHFESEQFTMDLIGRKLGEILPTFATRFTGIITNPIHCS